MRIFKDLRAKQTKNHFDSSKFCVQIFAPNITNPMRIVCEKMEAAKIDVFWFKMQTNSQQSMSKFTGSKKIGSNLFLVEGVMNNFYHSPVRYESLSVLSSMKKEYVLRVDDDEVVSDQLVKYIETTQRVLDNGSAIAIRRLWVRRSKSKEWMRSKSAFSPGESYDWQTRLFRIKDAKTATGVHDGDFRFRKVEKCIDSGVQIFHLILEILDLESRVNRVAHYESVLAGSGLSKIRYYVPELLGTSGLYETLDEATQTEINTWNLYP